MTLRAGLMPFWLCLGLWPLGAAADTLRIATSGHYPPYYITTPGAATTGMDIDLLGEICARGGYDCVWFEVPTQSLLNTLLTGQADVVAGGIGINADRAAIVDFTCPYYSLTASSGELFLRDPARGPDVATNGAVIAVSGGSLFELAMQREGIKTHAYDTEQDAARAMLAGDTDGYFGSGAVVSGLPGGDSALYIGTYPTITAGPAFAVSKSAPDLLRILNTHLAELSAEGILAELQVRWLGQNQGDVIATCTTTTALS